MTATPGTGTDRPRSVGVREVAARAQVSLGTVSNVMNAPARVGAATRARVEAAMAELGFVPSRAAGQLRSRRSALAGVVVPDVGNPYWASVLRGIESVLDDAGLALVVGSTHQDPPRQRRLLRELASQGVDGLVVAPISGGGAWEEFASSRFGVVALERSRAGSAAAWVSLDHVEGGRLAAAHLLDLGHERIAFINGPHSVSWCAARLKGVRSALEERRPSDESALVEVTVRDLTVPEGRAAAARLLAAGTGATAVMCANDLVALGALLELRERGVDVPGDLALVGYDDVDFAAALWPPLTTVRQPAFDIGAAAARLLLQGSGRAAGHHIEFAPRLVARESTLGR